jgi:hypothetical protein
MGITRKSGNFAAAIGATLILLAPVGLGAGCRLQFPEPVLETNVDAKIAQTYPDSQGPKLASRKGEARGAALACPWQGWPNEGFRVAMALEQPFTATESVTEWRALPGNKKERRQMKQKFLGAKMSRDGMKLISTFPSIFIGRDGEGRVLLTLSTIYQPNDGLTDLDTILCDPKEKSVIWRIGSDSNLAPGSIVHGQIVSEPSLKSLP